MASSIIGTKSRTSMAPWQTHSPYLLKQDNTKGGIMQRANEAYRIILACIKHQSQKNKNN